MSLCVQSYKPCIPRITAPGHDRTVLPLSETHLPCVFHSSFPLCPPCRLSESVLSRRASG